MFKIIKNIKKQKMSLAEKYKLVENYLSPEPELDTMIYYINTGYKKSHGDSRKIKDKEIR